MKDNSLTTHSSASFLSLYPMFSALQIDYCSVQVLNDLVQRMVYDEIHGYSLTSINPFLDNSSPKDHAFVDEFSCI
ncbi:hypothetical protein HN51_066528, partial [Arachis hypogaea]